MAAIEKLGMTDDEVMDACGVLPVATNPDADELEAAFWFHRSFVQNSFKGEICMSAIACVNTHSPVKVLCLGHPFEARL